MTDVAETTEARLLGLGAAASYLDINLMTLRRLVARGVLQPVRLPMLRRVLFDRQDLDSLIEAGKEAHDAVINTGERRPGVQVEEVAHGG